MCKYWEEQRPVLRHQEYFSSSTKPNSTQMGTKTEHAFPGVKSGSCSVSFLMDSLRDSHKGLLLNRRQMLGKGSVVPLHCQVGFTAEGPTGPLPWRRWVSMCFSFSWPPEQMAVTVSIVSSSLWNGANFGEHALETNIWQSGSYLEGFSASATLGRLKAVPSRLGLKC